MLDIEEISKIFESHSLQDVNMDIEGFAGLGHTLRAGQNVFNGECYATYGGLCEAFASKNFTAKSVRAVLDAAMEIPV